MASDGIDDEKPNLRPTYFLDANGKPLGRGFEIMRLWSGSFIHATLNAPTYKHKSDVLDKPGLLGIERTHLQYSFHRKSRWLLLDDIRESLIHSSDDESSAETEWRRQRSYSSSTLPQGTYHIEIINDLSERFRKRSRKPLSIQLTVETTRSEGHTKNFHTCIEIDTSPSQTVPDGITYVIDVSTRRKPIPFIRTSNHSQSKCTLCKAYRPSKTFRLEKQQSDDEMEVLSSADDDDEFLNSLCSTKIKPLQLNDFLPHPTEKFQSKSRSKYHNTKQFFDPETCKKNIHYEYSTVDVHTVRSQSKQKLSRHFMPLSFRSVALEKTELTQEYLSETYGKHFIEAQCFPTKYLICLTDRFKSFSCSNSYLILVWNESTCHVQVGVNIDLNVEMFELQDLLAPERKIYRVEELIEKAIELLATLPVKVSQSMDVAISQRKLAKDDTNRHLSDIEFLHKQIQQVQSLNNSHIQTELSDPICSRPKICTICCEDMDKMTALKTCGHWLCDNCWKQYLENSIEQVKLITCPQWNCTSVLDAGTFLSLVNVRCLSIYECHIEKCLLNLSPFYAQCPLVSCSNIIPLNELSTSDGAQCRCGYQFCLDCKREAHFPATCLSYRVYIETAKRNGHLSANFMRTTTVVGRKCVSCNNFIEKNGGCNHMTCRCSAEFCWICTRYWREHFMSSGVWRCPTGAVSLQERVLVNDTSLSGDLYASAICHRQQRTFQVQTKFRENVKRLVATITMNDVVNKVELDERGALLEQCYQMVEYIKYLHQICEFTCVCAQGYHNQPKEFFNSLQQLEWILFSFIRIFENGRGYSTIEQLNQLYRRSETLIQRLRHAVRLRRRNTKEYATS